MRKTYRACRRPSPRDAVELKLAAQAAEERRQPCPIAAFLQDRVWDALDHELEPVRRTQLEDVLLRLAGQISVGQDVTEEESALGVAAGTPGVNAMQRRLGSTACQRGSDLRFAAR